MMDLVLVAKHWTPGKAKTRLASRIGAEAAAELSRLFLIASLSHFAGLGERHWLAFTPIEERQAFQELITDTRWQLVPQAAGTLGERLQAILRDRFCDGARGVIFLGSDSPLLALEHLREAIGLLASHDVVVGPATDGGYYLIGFSRDLPQILQEIDWGTALVMEQTRQRLAATPHLRWATLPMAADVDDYDDLLALKSELHRQRADLSPSLLSLANRVEAICARQDALER